LPRAGKLDSGPRVKDLGMGRRCATMKPNDELEPTVFVIFGGAGDLTSRKLVPALFDLSQDRSLPAYFSVLAIDRVDLSDGTLRRRQEIRMPLHSEERCMAGICQTSPISAGRFHLVIPRSLLRGQSFLVPSGAWQTRGRRPSERERTVRGKSTTVLSFP